jgi:hypothetical protein
MVDSSSTNKMQSSEESALMSKAEKFHDVLSFIIGSGILFTMTEEQVTNVTSRISLKLCVVLFHY